MSQAWQVYAEDSGKVRHFTIAADDEPEARGYVSQYYPAANILSCGLLNPKALATLNLSCPAVLEWKPMSEVKKPYVIADKKK